MLRRENSDVDYLFSSHHNHTVLSEGEYGPEESVRKAIALHFHAIEITHHHE